MQRPKTRPRQVIPILCRGLEGEKRKGKMISITQYNKAHTRLRIRIYRSIIYITRFWQQKHLSFLQAISKRCIKIAQKRREAVNAVSECLKELSKLQRYSLGGVLQMSTIVTSLCSLCFTQNYVVRIQTRVKKIWQK
jgi:hypothetical protein